MGALKDTLKKTALYKVYSALRRRIHSLLHKKVVFAKNVLHAHHKKNCLFIYIVHPFMSKTIKHRHQNEWQAIEFAKAFDRRGYNVDVADYQAENVKLPRGKKYDLVIGLIPRGIDIYSAHIRDGAKIVSYLTGSNMSFGLAQATKRLSDVEKRRGVKWPQTLIKTFIEKRIETFDACFMIGNAYNFKSYTDEFDMPPVYYIRNNGYDLPFKIDMTKKSAHKFLFFASATQVHKGLDLLLEVFASFAKDGFDAELYVCSWYEREKEFCEEYHKELFETENIHACGFVDIFSDTFKNIVESCAYTILPSCAEGQAGSVLSAMSGGCIPILSNVCGYDESDAIILSDCSLGTIERTVREYAAKDATWIATQSQKALDTVRTKYSEGAFIDSVEKALDGVLGRGDE